MISRPGQNKPETFRKTRLLAAALAFLAVSLACSISIPFFPTPTPVPTAEAPQGLIAYVGVDGNIYTTDRDGKQHTAVTQDAELNPAAGQVERIYQYPTWAPDGQRLAFIGFSRSAAAGVRASLFSSTADGKQRVEAFTSQDTLPFYLFWSPNSQAISFLGNDASGGIALFLAAAGGGDSKGVSSGQPYYWDWSPDARTLIVHTGGAASDNPDARLALIELDGSIQKTELELKPGLFQAPAWSPAGDELALTTQNDAGDGELVLAGRDGKVKRVLVQLNGPAAFGWSPRGGNLAYATLVEAAAGPTTRLVLLDTAQPDQPKEIARGDVAAFFWSPDGQKIAILIQGSQPPGNNALIAQTTPPINLAVQVYDLASGNSRQVAVFSPTDAFQQVFPFYDQYQRSGTLWSPDSRSLVLAGVDPAGEDAIYVVGADGSAFHKIATGDLAFWSWK